MIDWLFAKAGSSVATPDCSLYRKIFFTFSWWLQDVIKRKRKENKKMEINLGK